MKPKKIIIDTDIGDDIDDAFALSLACVMPEVDVLGVVTVFKDVDTRCKMAKMMLSLGGKDVPVYKGMSRPLAQTSMYGKPIDFNQKLWSYVEDCEKYAGRFDDGFDFYVRTLEGAKEPITIVTIGALTNVGHLLLTRPDLKEKIEKIVIMGGAYEMNYEEYNFTCDPEAAEAVVHSGVELVAVGLDITSKCYLDSADLKKLGKVGHPLTEMLLKLLAPGQQIVYLHDPLTLFYLADPSIFTFRRDIVHVEVKGEYTRGMVVKFDNCNWQINSEGSPFRYAIQCDCRKFVDEYVNRLTGLTK